MRPIVTVDLVVWQPNVHGPRDGDCLRLDMGVGEQIRPIRR